MRQAVTAAVATIAVGLMIIVSRPTPRMDVGAPIFNPSHPPPVIVVRTPPPGAVKARPTETPIIVVIAP